MLLVYAPRTYPYTGRWRQVVVGKAWCSDGGELLPCMVAAHMPFSKPMPACVCVRHVQW